VSWEKIAKRTSVFREQTGEYVKRSGILAARLAKKAIDMADLEEAATKVKLGPEKKRLQTEEDRKMTAYHEAGHALVSWLCHTWIRCTAFHRFTRDDLGHTMMEPMDRIHETKTHLIEQIAVMLGVGRESLVLTKSLQGRR